MDIGQKLKEQRTARGFSQEQLADMLGVARQTIANWEMAWFAQGTWDGDPTSIPSTDFRGYATICLQFHEDSVTALTLIEEYHREDFCETREYTLQKDKNDEFPLPEPLTKRDDTPGAYILYRIPWDGGEYLFCINY